MKTNTHGLKLIVVQACLIPWQLLHGTAFQELYSFPLGPANPNGKLVEGPDGAFYGTTSSGGAGNAGTVFRVTTNGNLTTIAAFWGTNGSAPNAGLALGSDGAFYGTTGSGTDGGTVFRVTTNGVLSSLASVGYTMYESQMTGMALGADGVFYGSIPEGGTKGCGTIFRVTTNGDFTTIYTFPGTNGVMPGPLVLGSDGALYGSTPFTEKHIISSNSWSMDGDGTVFRVTTNGVLTTLFECGKTDLLAGKDGALYFTLHWYNDIYRMTPDGDFTNLAHFDDPDLLHPALLAQGVDGVFYGATRAGGSNDCGTFFSVTTNGVISTLVSFASPDQTVGDNGLALGSDGNLYGTTPYGGIGLGSVYRVTTNGTLTTLFSFVDALPVGLSPEGGLALGDDGAYFGTTARGGNFGLGTVFRITTNGAFTSLASFDGTNGAGPVGTLARGPDGSFYGTTRGQVYPTPVTSSNGTIFRITTDGILTNVLLFDGTNGANPAAGLTLGTDGAFYGITVGGGNCNEGTAFRITVSGEFTLLASFCGTNGSGPSGKLAQGNDGTFLGTTAGGGNTVVVPGPRGHQLTISYGTVFRLTTNGIIVPLFLFGGTNGASPAAGLALGSDGAFYGTTARGGPADQGTIFRVTTNGLLTTLAFCDSTTGVEPQTEMVLGADGAFYGSTSHMFQGQWQGDNSAIGFAYGPGSIFRLTANGTLTVLQKSLGPIWLAFGTDGTIYATSSTGGSRGGGSVFRLSAWSFFATPLMTNGNYVVQMTGQPGVPFTVESATTVTGPWQKKTNLTAPILDQGLGIGVIEFNEPVESGGGRFYRTVYPAY